MLLFFLINSCEMFEREEFVLDRPNLISLVIMTVKFL
jgi:hypothetical protein